MNPAEQVEQTTIDDAEYVPLPQRVHEVAPDVTTPVLAPISTMDPAAHVEQTEVEDAEYVPIPQGVHEVAPDVTTPVLAPISTIDPAAHVEQAEFDVAVLYVLTEHAVQYGFALISPFPVNPG